MPSFTRIEHRERVAEFWQIKSLQCGPFYTVSLLETAIFVTAQVRIGRSRSPQGGEPVFGVLGQGLDDVPTLLFSGRYE